MPGYSTRNEKVTIGGQMYLLRVLSDKQQFSDPDGHGARLGISSAQWSLFGQLWPSGRLLAQAMSRFDIEDKRILELGCGIGLASLVLMQRGGNVVASDIHPLAEPFLAYNAALNALPAVHYRQLRWDRELPSLGTFDLIIASDVLYEQGHAALMAEVIRRHAKPRTEVVITDPGRGNSARFSRALGLQGFDLKSTRCRLNDADVEPFRGQLLHYSRDVEAVAR
ncbi:protein N-lysine methyltransferase family protein [Stenotrophomonas sp. SY1]|jgi:predicted nicotinamide N-methyase|uniref:class I SAM-dependent methyltransferase n=1 Tax=Stenotrophomonas sp. SY1 TaxID=477235 RepID=UPI001E53F394|nr:protein N-lysine methyltransferase family protein [Stenotrophomonas sp. SY1]MCD9088137.1 protein N-lysine methyltransferase family protein [Stenotrophomonas sp. SY1]